MRIGFVTCVQLGLSCMETIFSIGGHLDVVFTLKDKIGRAKSGRVYLDDFAAKHGVPLVKFGNINKAKALAAITEANLDWLFIIGWSQIAHPPVLKAVRQGVLGMHPTLLPEGRGRAAIPWAILKGLDYTGVTLFQLDEGVDTGPILGQEVLRIDPQETATTLYAKVNVAHEKLIASIWADLVHDRLKPMPQDHAKATLWPGRKPDDGEIFPNMTAAEVERLVRAVTDPYPGAFVDYGTKRLRIKAGRIGIPHQTPSDDCVRVVLADGVYDALHFLWEPLG